MNENIFRNTVKPGGYCSIHRHAKKRQVIVCTRGKLLIEIFNDPHYPYSPFTKELSSGESLLTHALVWHRFTSRGGCQFTELYLPLEDFGREPSDDDIDRFDTGGVHSANLVS